jgi:hypothetical protein
VLSLCQFLIQPPKHLYNTQCCWCDRVREITTWRGYTTVVSTVIRVVGCLRSDNGNTSVTFRITQANHFARPFIERGQSGTQVGRVTTI